MATIKEPKTKVCVLFGGMSTEYQISLRSAYNVIHALSNAGYEVLMTGITPEGKWIPFSGDTKSLLDDTWLKKTTPPKINPPINFNPQSIKDFLITIIGTTPDIIFPVLHGINCEDGTIQGVLELSGIPYVGCNVTASALGMDKLLSRRIFKSANIPCCKFISVSRDDLKNKFSKIQSRVEKRFGYPCFVKPNNGGSSVGTYKVASEDELLDALKKACEYDYYCIIEEWIPAREIEVAVLGNDNPILSVPGEILTAKGVEFYDYKTKYLDENGSSLCIPARITPNMETKIKRYAKKAYKLLGCSGLARVDFFVDINTDRILLNEINTMPGFTPISLYPSALEASGYPIEVLVSELCKYALDYKKSRKRIESYDQN